MNTSPETIHSQISSDFSDSNSSSSNSLSTADLIEIRRFLEGKSRIVDLTETLSSQSAVEPFAGFFRVDEHGAPTIEVISQAWSALETKLSQVIQWQADRDAIESEATQFEVGDMERLRKVAKGKHCIATGRAEHSHPKSQLLLDERCLRTILI